MSVLENNQLKEQRKELRSWLEEENETNKRWKELVKSLGYVEEPCIKCGRCRVEKYENGDLICEKCYFNQVTKEYEQHLDI